jgi:hypothetical protein
MRHRITVVACIGVMICAGPAFARQAEPQWVGGANGTLPDGAIPYGREADGRAQFVCRGALRGGSVLGHISSGMSGCSVGFERREIVLPDYEVMVRPLPPPAVTTMSPAVMEHAKVFKTPASSHAAMEGVKVQPGKAAGTTFGGSTGGGVIGGGTVPPTPPDTATRRGFDDKGQPYVEVTLPDGTVKRTQRSGVTLIKPDGSSQFIPNRYTYANAPPATPPVLPDDPTEGRMWVDRHNQALLSLISDLVQHNDDEMRKFSDGERQTVGDDPFGQIVYRTTVADFLANMR